MGILGTGALRADWAPPCTGPWARISLNGTGKISVRPATVDAWLALNACLVAHGYGTRAGDTGAYNCRPITGGSGYSLHAYGIAGDINWSTNPYGPVLHTDMPRAMVDAILAIRTNDGAQVFGWGGNYRGNKDPMHYEVVCTPQQLARGIAAAIGSTPLPPPPSQIGALLMAYPTVLVKDPRVNDLAVWQVGPTEKHLLPNTRAIDLNRAFGFLPTAETQSTPYVLDGNPATGDFAWFDSLRIV